jgi:RHS repeat-associated protein
MGYSGGDGVRQQFTQKERDVETGLDYFLARYYSSTQGRFTSPDEFKGGSDEVYALGSRDEEKQALPYAEITNPQSLNKYHYCLNNPLRFIDPDGHQQQGESLYDKLMRYLSLIWKSKNRTGGMIPEDNPDQKGGNGPLDMDARKLSLNHIKETGEAFNTLAEVMVTLEPTGVTYTAKKVMEGDSVGAAIGAMGIVFKTGGAGRIAFNEAKTLVGAWAKDPIKGTISSAIKYHFKEHGAQVGARNVVSYMRKALHFAKNLKGAKSHPVEGLTEGVTRYIKNGRYVDLDPQGKIISFGSVR